jgi:hypothetical protein
MVLGSKIMVNENKIEEQQDSEQEAAMVEEDKPVVSTSSTPTSSTAPPAVNSMRQEVPGLATVAPASLRH